MENAAASAYAVERGQVAIALTLAATAAVIILAKREERRRAALVLAAIALAGGALMNANFYLAAGWTSPGTKGSNIVMFWSQAVIIHV
jgi:hypothetical protein